MAELRRSVEMVEEESHTRKEQLSDVQVGLTIQEEIIQNLQEVMNRFAGQPRFNGGSSSIGNT